MDAVSVLTPSVVCFILWAIQTPNRPQTQLILRCGEKICGTGEMYLTISSHKTRTSVRTKLNFPFCALKFMQLMCRTVNGFAVAVGWEVGEWESENERGVRVWLFLSFDFFLATLERNHSYCLLKVCKLIVYIIIIKLKLLLDK